MVYFSRLVWGGNPLSHSDKKGAPLRKGSKKAEARELGARIAEATEPKDSGQPQAADLHAELQNVSKRAADLEDQLRKARDETRAAQDRADDLERRVREEAGTTRKHFDELHETLKRVRTEREQAVSGASGLSQAVAALRKRLEESRAEAKELQAGWVQLEERAAGAESRVGELEGRVKDLSIQASKISGLAEEAASLRRQLEDARAESKKLQEARDAAEGRAAELDRRLAGEAAALRRELDAARADLEATRETRVQAEKEIADLRAESERAQAKAAQMDRYFQTLERELLEAREAASKAAEPAPVPPAPAAPPPEPPMPEHRPTPVDSLFDPEPPPPPPLPAPVPVAAAIPPPQPVPAPASSPETTLRPQHTFGPAGPDGQPAYLLHELLPPDAMGVVYRASERATGRQFAVRFMAGQAGEEQTQVIEREVEKLIALPHPNILHVQGSGRRKNRLYLAMDLVQAPTLARAKIHDLRRVLAILCDVAGAIHYAHEEGIHHGDLNPDNIVVAKDGEQDHPLVKDFELGFLLETLVAAPSTKEGRPSLRNPAYLPPEQINEAKPKLTVAGDVYGLGATLYAALGGRAPFEGKDAAQIRTRVMFEEPAPLAKLRPDLPEPVAAIIRRAMVKESGLRYATAKEFHDALAKLLTS